MFLIHLAVLKNQGAMDRLTKKKSASSKKEDQEKHSSANSSSPNSPTTPLLRKLLAESMLDDEEPAAKKQRVANKKSGPLHSTVKLEEEKQLDRAKREPKDELLDNTQDQGSNDQQDCITAFIAEIKSRNLVKNYFLTTEFKGKNLENRMIHNRLLLDRNKTPPMFDGVPGWPEDRAAIEIKNEIGTRANSNVLSVQARVNQTNNEAAQTGNRPLDVKNLIGSPIFSPNIGTTTSTGGQNMMQAGAAQPFQNQNNNNPLNVLINAIEQLEANNQNQQQQIVNMQNHLEGGHVSFHYGVDQHMRPYPWGSALYFATSNGGSFTFSTLQPLGMRSNTSNQGPPTAQGNAYNILHDTARFRAFLNDLLRQTATTDSNQNGTGPAPRDGQPSGKQ